jgi:signal recognition particle subunit SRP68
LNRCLNIAYSHALLSSPRNALALLIRAESLSERATESLSSPSTPSNTPTKLDIPISALKFLYSRIQSLILHNRALVELHNHNENSRIAAKKHQSSAAPVVEMLDRYPPSGEVDLKKLVDWPPKLKPVPVKPLFFDTAWNYIEYPGRETESAAAREDKDQEEKPAKKGWFGFGRS